MRLVILVLLPLLLPTLSAAAGTFDYQCPIAGTCAGEYDRPASTSAPCPERGDEVSTTAAGGNVSARILHACGSNFAHSDALVIDWRQAPNGLNRISVGSGRNDQLQATVVVVFVGGVPTTLAVTVPGQYLFPDAGQGNLLP